MCFINGESSRFFLCLFSFLFLVLQSNTKDAKMRCPFTDKLQVGNISLLLCELKQFSNDANYVEAYGWPFLELFNNEKMTFSTAALFSCSSFPSLQTIMRRELHCPDDRTLTCNISWSDYGSPRLRIYLRPANFDNSHSCIILMRNIITNVRKTCFEHHTMKESRVGLLHTYFDALDSLAHKLF